MSNYITDIQLSGVTYTLSGQSSGTSVVELTQAEFDALVASGTVQSNTFYIITDSDVKYMTSAQTQSAITEATSGKVDSSSVVSSVTSASTDSEIPTAKAVYDAIPTVTNTITSGSNDAITSGAVYDALGDIETLLSNI